MNKSKIMVVGGGGSLFRREMKRFTMHLSLAHLTVLAKKLSALLVLCCLGCATSEYVKKKEEEEATRQRILELDTVLSLPIPMEISTVFELENGVGTFKKRIVDNAINVYRNNNVDLSAAEA